MEKVIFGLHMHALRPNALMFSDGGGGLYREKHIVRCVKQQGATYWISFYEKTMQHIGFYVERCFRDS